MDKNLVIKTATQRSGPFIFSRKFSAEELLALKIEATILYKTVTDLPILPKLATSLQEELIIRSIFGTAAIEGNPLSEEKVANLITKDAQQKSNKRAETEIQNLKTAYDYIRRFDYAQRPFLLTEDSIKELHRLVTQDIPYKLNTPGTYRAHVVKVGDAEHGGTYTPPKTLNDVKNLMKIFVIWINDDALLNTDPFIRAGLAHYHLGLIHPFGDGNGRTARLIEALLLKAANIKHVPVMLSNFYYKYIDDYFWAFSNTLQSKEYTTTPFLLFMYQGIVESLQEIKGRITYFIRKFTLQDFYAHLRQTKKIGQRQYDLLILLLDYPKPFTLNDLRSTSPFQMLYRTVSDRTGRRDLDKLKQKDLLLEEEGKYRLNERYLD